MTSTFDRKVCLSEKPICAIVCFIISIVIAIISISLCFILRYKFCNNIASILIDIFSLMFCISFELIFVFNYLGRNIIIDFSKDIIICKKILGFSFRLKKTDINDVEIVENKKGKNFLIINNLKYNYIFINPFKIKYDEKVLMVIKDFIKSSL